jgi:hypothetical protein
MQGARHCRASCADALRAAQGDAGQPMQAMDGRTGGSVAGCGLRLKPVPRLSKGRFYTPAPAAAPRRAASPDSTAAAGAACPIR